MSVFKSIAKAEEAAYNGQGGSEWDSQNCRDYQAEILSSSPAPPREQQQNAVGASKSNLNINTTATNDEEEVPDIADDHGKNGKDKLQLLPPGWAAQEAGLEANPEPDLELKLEISPIIHPQEEATSTQQGPEKPADPVLVEPAPSLHSHPTVPTNFNDQTTQQHKKLARDSRGRLRLLDHEGNIVNPQRRGAKTMEAVNATQKSSMSPTQQNSDSVYEGYNFQSRSMLQSSLNRSLEHAPPNANMQSKNQSLFTDSTPHTYGENDTGHLAFDLTALHQNSQDQEEEPESQDPPYLPPPQLSMSSYEPKTPAAPVNPFKNKGSVMKGLDMFGATQASSTIRAAFHSPTSSRPSPNVFNQMTTPGLPSSPLQRGAHHSPTEFQNSLIARAENETSESPEIFRTAPDNIQSSVIKPRAYRSLKESQARQIMAAAETDSETESDASISSNPAEARRLKRQQKIQREQAAVSIRQSRGSSSRPPSSPAAVIRPTRRSSNRAQSSPVAASGTVEVPSTSKHEPSASNGKPPFSTGGRRRSLEDEYIAQCTGLDARDTQQDEVITDSQVLPSNDLPDMDRDPERFSQSISQIAESSIQPNRKPSTHVHHSPTESGLQLEATLDPSQGLPVVSVLSQAVSNGLDDMMVPETSPTRSDRIRRMDDIASFSREEDEDIGELPGFTQDIDFELAIARSTEPSAPQKPSLKVKAAQSSAPEFSPPRRSSRKNKPLEPSDESLRGEASPSQLSPRHVSPHELLLSSRESLPQPPSLPILSSLLPSEHAADADGVLEPSSNAATSNSGLISQQNEITEPQSTLPVEPEENAEIEMVDAASPKPALGNLVPIPLLQQSLESPTLPTTAANRTLRKPIQRSKLVKTPSISRQELKVIEAEALDSKQNDDPISKPQTPIPSHEPESSALSSLPDIEFDEAMNVSMVIHGMSGTEDNPASSENVPNEVEELPVLLQPAIKATPKAKKIAKYGKGSGSKPRPAAKSSSPSVDDLANSPSMSVAPKPTRKTKAPPKKRATVCKSIQSASVPSSRDQTPTTTQTKRVVSKKKSGSLLNGTVEGATAPTRSSKRKSLAPCHRESSDDPLTLGHVASTASKKMKQVEGIFSNMAFAVSYLSEEGEKEEIMELILDNGGQILEDGFDTLFNKSATTPTSDAKELKLLATAEKIGFTALIADQHSRRVKYIQALALGLPCISGKWIKECISKGLVIDWSPYLLCAGQSTFLGDAYRSRNLQPYPALEANLVETFESRDQWLDGKSILFVTGRGKRSEARVPYVFLTRALGPARIGHVVDLAEAREKLTEGEKDGKDWDMVYVQKIEDGADAALFDTPPSGTQKRKRTSTAASQDTPAPKRVRVICDETVVQSLILGQLMDD